MQPLEDEDGESLSASFTKFLEAKSKLSACLKNFINEDGKILWERHPPLVAARAELFESYVRHKYNGNLLGTAKDIIQGNLSPDEFREQLVQLVCRSKTSEAQHGSQHYRVQTSIRKCFSSFFLTTIRGVEEHHQQQEQLLKVRSYCVFAFVSYSFSAVT